MTSNVIGPLIAGLFSEFGWTIPKSRALGKTLKIIKCAIVTFVVCSSGEITRFSNPYVHSIFWKSKKSWFVSWAFGMRARHSSE